MAIVATLATGAGVAVAANNSSTQELWSSSAVTLATGAGVTEAKFVAINPCRIVDTRLGTAGPVRAGGMRSYLASAPADTVAAQGGDPAGCGIPSGVTAIEATITAASPGGIGSLRAWSFGSTEPQTLFLSFPAGNITNTGTVQINTAGAKDFSVRVMRKATDVVIDVQGYFAAPMAAFVSAAGVFDPARSSRVVSSGRVTPFNGWYEVEFDRDVSACVYNATSSVTSSQIQAQPRSSKPNFVFVATGPVQNWVDDSFYLTVTC